MIEIHATLFYGKMRVLGWAEDEAGARILLDAALASSAWSEPIELIEIPDPVPPPPAPRVST